MTNRFTRRLTYGKRMLLASAAVLVIAAPIVAGLLNPPRGRAQAPYGGAGGPGLAFDAASVKATPPPDQIGPSRMQGAGRPGQFTSTNMPLRNLIWLAYSVPADQQDAVSGLPPDSARYDIVAKAPAGTTRDRFAMMLQNLLVDRFHLAVHWRQTEVKAYDLVVAKGGSKLRKAASLPDNMAAEGSAQVSAPGFEWPTDKNGWPVYPAGIPRIGLVGKPGTETAHVTARVQTIADLLRVVGPQTGRPVTDKTGLTGTYDFTLDFQPPRSASDQSSSSDAPSEPYPDLFAALEHQLGLKLVSSKALIRVLAVDGFDLKPAAN